MSNLSPWVSACLAMCLPSGQLVQKSQRLNNCFSKEQVKCNKVKNASRPPKKTTKCKLHHPQSPCGQGFFLEYNDRVVGLPSHLTQCFNYNTLSPTTMSVTGKVIIILAANGWQTLHVPFFSSFCLKSKHKSSKLWEDFDLIGFNDAPEMFLSIFRIHVLVIAAQFVFQHTETIH